ncbi:MAG: ammonium transporter [Bacteroidales bacterium]|nr:ammonium transporter [Bacteroidales bacterium]
MLAAVDATAETADAITSLTVSIDTVWVLLGSMLVFIMQAGFAMVESGFARTKNTANILMKNLLDFSVGSILFWAVGFGIMFGASHWGLVGSIDLFGLAGWNGEIPGTAFLVFQTMFSATSATIVSGAVAERTKFHAYLIYSVCIFGLIYPISGHWGWGGGWLSELGFHDFAGSAIVHSLGGWLAFAGACVVGPRLGKYRKGRTYAIPGHNLTLATLGVFLLWFGWFGFNPCSQLGASGESAQIISDVFMTTNIAAAGGGVAALLFAWFRYGKPSLSLSLNGVLAGLVGITAGCDLVSPAGALAIGVISGVVMILAVALFDHVLKIDDPVGAISVHGVCGTLGTILTGVFAMDGGALYGGGFSFLGIQILGAFTYLGWGLLTGFALFKAIDFTIGMRVDKRIEEEGLDVYEHGETAYN